MYKNILWVAIAILGLVWLSSYNNSSQVANNADKYLTPTPIPTPVNRYIPKTNNPILYFYDDPCLEDCSGHEAGYEWAEEHGITDPDDCGGNSQSFIEGCESYAEEQ